MDSWVIDIVSALVSGIVLLISLLALPAIMEPGIAYLLAVIIFILTISGAGFYMNKSIN